ncbi:MAG: CPBP family intramembrane metalloprotease [Victivallales bacterium]|nr:CPBP family intramembrane metalloprotease [Victivallales bacterium]
MSDKGINWRTVLGWFCGEPLHCQPDRELLARDREYRPVCAIGLLSLLAGLLLFIGIRSCFTELSQMKLLLLSIMPYQIFAFGGCLLALFPSVRRNGFREAYDFPSQPEDFRTMLNASLRFLLLIYPVILILNGVSSYLCQTLGIQPTSQVIEALGREGDLLYWMASGVSSIIIAPIAEEVLIRLVLFRCIRSISPLWAGFLSSVLFGLMHGHPQYVLSLFFLGMCLQHARSLGGIPRAILLHSLYNLVAFILLFTNTTG